MRSISAAEAATMTGLHIETIRGYLRIGRIKSHRLGRTYLVDPRDLRSVLAYPPRRGRPHKVKVTPRW